MSQLQADEKRVLEHFWNPIQRVRRGKLPLSVIAFLDDEALKQPHIPSQTPSVLLILQKLSAKNYVHQFGGGLSTQFVYELDVEGVAYLERAHPQLLVLWDSVLARTPRLVSFLVAMIGFIASILGVVDFVSKKFI